MYTCVSIPEKINNTDVQHTENSDVAGRECSVAFNVLERRFFHGTCG